jgi:hypothetical protein
MYLREMTAGEGWEFFSSPPRPDRAHQPPIQWVPGALSLGVKRPGREANQSPPSSAEVKYEWALPPLPLYPFMAWSSVKAQGQLYLYFYFTYGY